jgi:8-oxo-dGTP diphosphatase
LNVIFKAVSEVLDSGTKTVADSTRPRHVTLAVVLQVRDARLHVLLEGNSLPGGELRSGETLEESVRRHLDPRPLAHLEQLETRSDPQRNPDAWELATAYLGLVPAGQTVAGDWSPVTRLPRLRHDHGAIVFAGRARLRAKLSYTNIGFALAPPRFTISELREIYVAALGHDVSATNLQRVLVRRRVLEPTGGQREPGRAGGRPAALFRFSSRKIEITDQFAVLRPPPR